VELAAGRRHDQVLRHLSVDFLHEVQAAAVHRHDDVRLELLDLRDHLRQVVLRRRPEMETADDSVHLFDARDLLRLPHRVHDAHVPARADDDEPLVLHVEAVGLLVDVLVGHDLAVHRRRQVEAGIAAHAVPDAELDVRVLVTSWESRRLCYRVVA
jgi:hypothetical protein